jgi:hypothetical protein
LAKIAPYPRDTLLTFAPERHMPKMRKKSDLPTKICVVCGLPFAWRKKWERDWDNVIHCSDRCRNAAKGKGQKASQ